MFGNKRYCKSCREKVSSKYRFCPSCGREIENYLSSDQVKEAIQKSKPSAKSTSKFAKYENVLSITTRGNKETQASKVDVARHITGAYEPDFKVLDLDKQIRKLVNFICASNPGLHIAGPQ